jgi:transcription elongation factor Elf1
LNCPQCGKRHKAEIVVDKEPYFGTVKKENQHPSSAKDTVKLPSTPLPPFPEGYIDTMLRTALGKKPEKKLYLDCPNCHSRTTKVSVSDTLTIYCNECNEYFPIKHIPTESEIKRYQESYIIFKDGNMWCAAPPGFVNLQETPFVGFGKTPKKALKDYFRALKQEKDMEEGNSHG